MKKLAQSLKDNRAFWKNPVAIIFGTLVLFFGSQLIGALIVTPLFPLVSSENTRLFLYIAANLSVLMLFLSVASRIIGFSWRQIGIKDVSLNHLFLTLPIFLVYIFLGTVLTQFAIKFLPGFDPTQTQDIGFSQTGGIARLMAFLSLVVLTPLFEELLFRGVLFKGLRQRLPLWVAIIFTSFIFAVAHGQLNVAIDTFALSVFLCLLVEKTGSIAPAILLHALKNGLAFYILFIHRG